MKKCLQSCFSVRQFYREIIRASVLVDSDVNTSQQSSLLARSHVPEAFSFGVCVCMLSAVCVCVCVCVCMLSAVCVCVCLCVCVHAQCSAGE